MELWDWLKVNGFGSFGALGALIGGVSVPAKSWGEMASRVLMGFLVSITLTPLVAPVCAGLIEKWVSRDAAAPWRDTPAPIGILIGLVAYWLVAALVAVARNTQRSAEVDETTFFDLRPSESDRTPPSPWDDSKDDQPADNPWDDGSKGSW